MNRLKDDIDLLLIGKTGNGKSALGNSILGRKSFMTENSMFLVTKNIQREVSEFNGRTIRVFDSPGLTDTTDLEIDKATNIKVTQAMKTAIRINPIGYHAFLLVTRFGGRFTAEDQGVIIALKNIFGEKFVKNYCILVLTCGDFFSPGSDASTFEEWCASQTGVFKDLVDECCNRVILFDNRTKDEDLKKNQVSDLIKMVDDLRWLELRYTDKNFEQALEARKKLSLENTKSIFQEEWMREISLIIQKLELVKKKKPEESLYPLTELQKRVQIVYDKVASQDEGTGILSDLQETVQNITKAIDGEVLIAKRLIEENQKLIIEEEKQSQYFEEVLKKQRHEYEKLIAEKLTDAERRQKLEEEHKNRMKEIEDEANRKKLERERNVSEAMAEERRRKKQIMEDIGKQYREVKSKNDRSTFKTVFNAISLDVQKIVHMKI